MADNSTDDEFNMESYEQQLDRAIKGVLPDDHAVHDRLDD